LYHHGKHTFSFISPEDQFQQQKWLLRFSIARSTVPAANLVGELVRGFKMKAIEAMVDRISLATLVDRGPCRLRLILDGVPFCYDFQLTTIAQFFI
jgi:hypothetical protein